MCLTTLCNLRGAQGVAAHAEELVRVGGHMALLTQLSAPAAAAQAQAAMAIGHMGKQPAALQSLVQRAASAHTTLLHSAHPSVQLQAVYALGIFAAEDEGAASAIQLAGAVAPLTTLLLSGASVDVKQHLALTLAHVARGNWPRLQRGWLPGPPRRVGCRLRRGAVRCQRRSLRWLMTSTSAVPSSQT